MIQNLHEKFSPNQFFQEGKIIFFGNFANFHANGSQISDERLIV